MKIKIQITHWITGSVLFEYEAEGNTIYKTLKEALSKGADLRGADLRGADLYGADLRGANLYGADDAFIEVWWHVHHEVLYEVLTEPIRKRINYIKNNKPKDEIETRLRLLKPVLGKFPITEKGWESLHKKECKDCPWNGKTIFPDRK